MEDITYGQVLDAVAPLLGIAPDRLAYRPDRRYGHFTAWDADAGERGARLLGSALFDLAFAAKYAAGEDGVEVDAEAVGRLKGFALFLLSSGRIAADELCRERATLAGLVREWRVSRM